VPKTVNAANECDARTAVSAASRACATSGGVAGMRDAMSPP
jgi:hypothetical protein